MTLETIMTEIRDELKESNRLKREQNKAFEGYSLNEDYEKDKAETERTTDIESSKENESKSENVEPDSNVPDESEMKKAVAKIIKGTDKEKKDKLKAKIKEIGAKKVSDIQPEQRQDIIDYVEELEND
jgi:GTP-dependent phosphoenolpyruvate carboxykinase